MVTWRRIGKIPGVSSDDIKNFREIKSKNKAKKEAELAKKKVKKKREYNNSPLKYKWAENNTKYISTIFYSKITKLKTQ